MKKLITIVLALAMLLPFALHANASQQLPQWSVSLQPNAGRNVTFSTITNPPAIIYEVASRGARGQAFTWHNLQQEFTRFSQMTDTEQFTQFTQLTGRLSGDPSAIVTFYGDGKLLHTLEMPVGENEILSFSVNIASVRMLKIRVRAPQRATVWLTASLIPCAEETAEASAWQAVQSMPRQALDAMRFAPRSPFDVPTQFFSRWGFN